jgi:hypothetical protein
MSAIISCTSVYINPLIICTENRKQLDYEIVETQNLLTDVQEMMADMIFYL